MQLILLLSVFVIATCGLIYELVAGTLASYLLGDSVTQFSTIIGVYLFSMGIGSFLSRYIERNLLAWFVQVEILVGVIGGVSSSILFVTFEEVSAFRVILYLLIVLTGTLVGLEIPLLLRILKDRLDFKDMVSKVFTFDYIGALLASVIFPLLLVPKLGLIRTSFFFGLLNIAVAYFFCVKFEEEVRWAKHLKRMAVFGIFLLLGGFVASDQILSFSESLTYPDPVVYSNSTPYQRIVITKARDLRLYLNGNLQFSSGDEYRYHEALVHPGLAALKNPTEVLVLGGGDGMAVREILKYPTVQHVTLVDLDGAMTRLFTNNTMLHDLNKHSLSAAKVKVENADAFEWMKANKRTFDFITIDFPDPTNYSLGKLYTTAFYRLVYRALKPEGTIVVQCTSPLAAPKSYWCIVHTLEDCGLHTLPYHAYVPSFGEWGYVLARKDTTYVSPEKYPDSLRFLSPDVFEELTSFPADMSERITQTNKLNNQALVTYFDEEWAVYGQ